MQVCGTSLLPSASASPSESADYTNCTDSGGEAIDCLEDAVRNLGALLGGILGGAAGAGLVGIFLCCCCWSSSSKKRKSQRPPPPNTPQPAPQAAQPPQVVNNTIVQAPVVMAEPGLAPMGAPVQGMVIAQPMVAVAQPAQPVRV